MAMMINLYAAWWGMLLGAVAGALTGLFFGDEQWLGGYSSWRRRMLRLGHISFFGIGFINLGFFLTARALNLDTGLRLPACLLMVAAIGMPLVCYLAALRKWFRHLFFIPAGAALLGLLVFAWGIPRI